MILRGDPGYIPKYWTDVSDSAKDLLSQLFNVAWLSLENLFFVWKLYNSFTVKSFSYIFFNFFFLGGRREKDFHRTSHAASLAKVILRFSTLFSFSVIIFNLYLFFSTVRTCKKFFRRQTVETYQKCYLAMNGMGESAIESLAGEMEKESRQSEGDKKEKRKKKKTVSEGKEEEKSQVPSGFDEYQIWCGCHKLREKLGRFSFDWERERKKKKWKKWLRVEGGEFFWIKVESFKLNASHSSLLLVLSLSRSWNFFPCISPFDVKVPLTAASPLLLGFFSAKRDRETAKDDGDFG